MKILKNVVAELALRKFCKASFATTLLLIFPLVALADNADSAYQAAHECYVKLKADPEAQKLRQSWEKCIGQFEVIAKKHRGHEKGRDAGFSLGLLYSGLAENSKNKADWLKSAHEYEAFAIGHSRNSMADDAYFSAAKVRWEHLGDKAEAKRDLLKVIKYYKTGDMAGEAERYLRDVEAGIVPKEEGQGARVKGQEIKGQGPRGKDEQRTTHDARRTTIIVIDPGHGGSDAGAVGPKGTLEKDVTLEISKALADRIKSKITGVQVFLTRDSDKSLTLDQRVKIANTKKADLFISIHANAANSKKMRGVQTYYLNNASDEAASRLAKQENKNAGRNLSDLEKIISTMLQNASTEDSHQLAKAVHKSLVSDLSKKYSGVADQKVRSALFYILVGAKCPSILIETSYVSNPKEEARLNSKKYQSAIADSVVKGLKQYLANI